MTKCLALSISLCLLVLFHGCLASRQQQQQQNECQLNRLQAREPDNRVQSEAGQIESWNYNDDDFQCAGVAAVRVTIEQNGLHLPSYTNAPQLIYVVQGKGVLGTVFPGCPETFEEPQQSEDQEQSYQQTRDRRQGQQEQDRRQGQQEQDRQQRQQEQDRRQRQQEQDRRQRQQGQRQQQGQQQFEQLDRHQKIRRIKEGDLIAIPAGVAYWSYNEGDQELVSVALLDTSNDQNQLDRNPRRFYLAGNPQDEFEQQQEGRQGSRQQHQREQQRDQDRQRQQDRRQRQQQGNSNNMFAGFDTNLLAEALNVDSETARQLQGQNDQNRNQIVRVKGRLDFVHPPRSRDPEQEQQQQEREQREREQRRQQGGRQQGQQESRGSRDNGLEETFCNLRLKENIGRPSSADVFTPQAGRISYLNSNNLPILRYLGLSAERGFLYNNAIYSPHWNLVAHEVFYVIRGNARVQVVNHQGEAILDDEVREGQLFIVPHNHAVLHKAGNQGFEYVAFKTEDNAVINTLAGRTSVLRALPDEVIANAYQVDREQARRLKYNRQETTVLSSSQQSDRSRRAIA